MATCALEITSNNVDSSLKDTGDDIANYLYGLDEINFSTKRIDVVICDHMWLLPSLIC